MSHAGSGWLDAQLWEFVNINWAKGWISELGKRAEVEFDEKDNSSWAIRRTAKRKVNKANESVTTAAVLASNGPSPLHDEDRDGA